MKQLEAEGFDFGKGYMFGFSFGAHLAITTATTFGAKRFKEIDGKAYLLFAFGCFEYKFHLHLWTVCDPGEYSTFKSSL